MLKILVKHIFLMFEAQLMYFEINEQQQYFKVNDFSVKTNFKQIVAQKDMNNEKIQL